MKRYILPLAFLISSLTTLAAPDSTLLAKNVTWQNRIDSIANIYQCKMRSIVEQKNETLAKQNSRKQRNVYSLRMVLPPTFYSSAVLQQFSAENNMQYNDTQLMCMWLVNKALSKSYVNTPESITQTDDQVEASGTIRTDVDASLSTNTKLTDKVVNVDLGTEMDEHVQLITRKPNFWKFSGSSSMQFTQSYFSENWFQGGNDNYSILGSLTLNANYDNKSNVQWENRLEVRLGFQTTGDTDKNRAMKPTDNLLRLTTKLGYKAYKTIYYSTQIQTNTQIVPVYDANSDNMRTNFLSPLNLSISVGLDYKFATKNNKFRGNIYLAPVSYNMKYVRLVELAGRHGIPSGQHAYHNFGPSITANAYWQILQNLSWNSRIYWVSNLSYTNIEWENTISFTINKYLNAKLFIYPKFDDSSKHYKGEHGYIMMKEWLSFGFNYSW
jgi:hypothetical protein